MKQSTLRREWNPCKICAYLDNENFEDTCKECIETKVEDHPGFYPANDFQQFLKKNNYILSEPETRFSRESIPIIVLSDSLYAVNDNRNLFSENYKVNLDYFEKLENNPKDIVYELSSLYDYNVIYNLPIDKEYRDAIYKNEYIMRWYLVYMLYNDSDKKKSLQYKLDNRFYHLTY